jgi:hypothetical protein
MRLFSRGVITLCNVPSHYTGNSCQVFTRGSITEQPNELQLSHFSCPHLRLKTPALASTRGASHIVALPIRLKSISRQKKNYGNSNISPYKNIIFQNSSKRNPKPSRYYNSIIKLKFQHKPKYHFSKVLI